MAAADMTKGNIFRHLIQYSVPLVLGNMFQLTYHAVDSMIAGRFIGKEALAAEGMAGPVMNLVILGISGICMGAGVLMSSFYGAREYHKLKREMSTAILFGLYFSLAVVILGIMATPALLRILCVPGELMGMTSLYLRIIFLGAPFTYFYNALASALKSVGDSKTSLKFLMFSSLLNGVLDLIFIGLLGFGIVCSAVTTVVAEAVSAGLSVWYVYRYVPMLRLGWGEWKLDRELLRVTLQYGSVTALQQSCQPVGKLCIQGAVNALGVDVIAAFHAVNRIDDFACMPEQSISHGITTFVAQNRGAVQKERMHRGFWQGLILEFGYWAGICSLVLLLREMVVGLFVPGEGSAEIVAEGSRYLGLMGLFYIFPAFTNGFQGFYRGMGMMKMTLLGTFIQTSLRVMFSWIFAPWWGIRGVAVACAAGWSVMLLVEVTYYFHIASDRLKKLR
ncbi:MAG: MATE family efflux transporter [Lachnospiraceae bacterium]|nr:MATE family efflux transporter [Lachnospiraceae bacterium]